VLDQDQRPDVILTLAKWVVRAACGVVALLFAFLAIAMGGGIPSPFPDTEITQQKPYADLVGREYRVVSKVSAYAWNDYPDKAKILAVSLMSPPGVKNRFVSYVTPLQPGQRIRLVSAWRRFAVFGFIRHYLVLVPGAGLPEGIPVTIYVESDGVPDPRVYEPIGE
jgi:hypothetical protein